MNPVRLEEQAPEDIVPAAVPTGPGERRIAEGVARIELRARGDQQVDGMAFGERRGAVLDKFRLRPCTTLHLPSRAQVAEAVAAAQAAFRASRLGPHERGAILDRTAALLEQRSDELVRALQLEVGFPASDGRRWREQSSRCR